MRDAERKRLVKLIEEAHKKSAEAIHELIMDTVKTKGRFNSKTDADRQSLYEIEADYLLENGVINLPVNAGDTIYRPFGNGVESWVVAKIELYPEEIVFIDDSENYFKESDIGVSTFLTKAEAEYALKLRRSVSLVNGHIEE